MWFLHMQEILSRLSHWDGLIPAILITAGVALLLGCCLGCSCGPCKDKDDLFHPHVK